METKLARMGDPLPLRLGARVVPDKERVPTPVDVDLTVKWVGDIMDDEVQVSDIDHPAAWDAKQSTKLGQLIFRGEHEPSASAAGVTLRTDPVVPDMLELRLERLRERLHEVCGVPVHIDLAKGSDDMTAVTTMMRAPVIAAEQIRKAQDAAMRELSAERLYASFAPPWLRNG
jgi:hypothetical protein